MMITMIWICSKRLILEIDSKTELIKANDGQEALTLLKTIMPDHIFLDINMPIMNGLECLRLIRMDARHKRIPVTILSTNFDTNAIVTCGALNAEFVCKPTNFEDLRSMLRRIFNMYAPL
jgi:CheY-like chemotaxis protein